MTRPEEKPARYPIRAVSRLTGIPIDTLRAWERRYGAVAPTRDDRGRVYSERDVARLRLINEAVSSGHSVGRVAGLSDADLRRLTTARLPAAVLPVPAPRAALDTTLFTAALLTLDSATLDREFSRLAAVLPPLALVRDVLLPALREVGDAWNRRRGGIAHEHLISAMLRHLLGSMLRVHSQRDGALRLLFATPAGDRHEIGILGAALLAASHGFAVSYVGPDLPAAQVVQAVRSSHAQVLVLGLTLSEHRTQRDRELRAIVRGLPPRVELWTGGPASAQHAALVSGRGVTLSDMDEYQTQLARLAETQRGRM